MQHKSAKAAQRQLNAAQASERSLMQHKPAESSESNSSWYKHKD
jgi:hypothetical protein